MYTHSAIFGNQKLENRRASGSICKLILPIS